LKIEYTTFDFQGEYGTIYRMIERSRLHSAVATALDRSRIVVLVGPRQAGKTTLARTFLGAQSENYLDLEQPEVEALLAQPMTALRDRHGLVVLDEIQRAPEIFKVLRVLADRTPSPARFLILGSASRNLLRQTSESLAGRTEVIDIEGFALDEVGADAARTLWFRGGFPLSFTAKSDTDSRVWRREFIRTFLELDLPQLGLTTPAPAMRRFWTMLAHFHGQTWNAAEPARSLGVSEPTVRRLLDWLSGTFMVRQLPPWHENIGKRQVKAPKIYLRDSGLLHELLGIPSPAALLTHPKSGASWEGFALENILRRYAPDEAYFWATHGGAELDLLMIKEGRRVGIEFKRNDAPKLTPSMRTALSDLHLENLYVVYPGSRRYVISEQVEVIPLATLAS
jgi:predicted AAA+ superfamily ATPase